MNFIYEVENFLDKRTCEDIIKRFEDDDRKIRGSTVSGVSSAIKVSTDLPIGLENFNSEWGDVNTKIAKLVDKEINNYFKYMFENGLVTKERPGYTLGSCGVAMPQIQKTVKNGYYRWHHDEQKDRLITYIIYLNDVEEGIGGTTDFKCGKSIQPRAGKLIFFPATWNYIHRGKKLEKGEKYIMTSFIIRTYH
jgi:hypothetical protein